MTGQESIPIIEYGVSANPLATFISVVAVGPIVEEILFRGLIYGALEGRLGVAGSIFVTSVMFALVHLQVLHFIPIFLVGVVLGWARWKTGSLGLPMLVHVLNNGFALLLLRFFERGA
ncbi:MAG TPA: CPBP family intramembrane glutamic endopeptidase [Verrucomicrobiae bacterium]|nr:CPBP family intramembrane glutamic endopeptidase [Verrucomicrobiae bacterium]